MILAKNTWPLGIQISRQKIEKFQGSLDQKFVINFGGKFEFRVGHVFLEKSRMTRTEKFVGIVGKCTKE
jgi:hypothetical protein